MHKTLMAAVALTLLTQTPAHAISAKYSQQLEHSGCTQASELQGCDITKSKAENAKAGFGSTTTPASTDAKAASTPYAGQWVAKSSEGATVATIRIDNKEQVWVNGKQVKAKRADGALLFKQGTITFAIQGDRRLKGEDVWLDSDAGTKGPINIE
ncbi:hypothetical protein ACW5XW_13300 [Aeromonas piscicola]|jgi:hypothetical protein|uniref:hypothetical protein n=1 Tax=Aeromonas piscicola TaxID=600645 RepID=UPI0005B38DCD|nr:hypothetical protein [Aeromonas piscicola]